MLLHQSLHEVGELEKVRDSSHRTILADGNVRLGPHVVRPLRRHRADGLLVDPEQQPHAVPVVPPTDADQLSAAERVEGVRYTHKALGRSGKTGIPS